MTLSSAVSTLSRAINLSPSRQIQSAVIRGAKTYLPAVAKCVPGVVSTIYANEKIIRKVAGEVKNHVSKYTNDDQIASAVGRTEEALGQFFKKTEEESNIENWDILANNFDHYNLEEIQHLLHEIFLHTDDPYLMQARAAQVFVKKVVSNCSDQLTKGYKINLPVVNEYGEKDLICYELDEIFDLWEGIPAFGFVDKHSGHAPLLCFRSTQYKLKDEYALAALTANFHHKGPAWHLYENGRDQIEAWLQKSTVHGENKARVMGYSQGGTTAAYYLTYLSEYVSSDRNKPSFVLDAPGVNHTVGSHWDALERKPYVLSYVTRGDLFPKIGDRILGHGYEIIVPNKMSFWETHSALSLLAPKWTVQAIDEKKEGQTYLRRIFTSFQKCLGHSIYPWLRDTAMPSLKKAIY